MTIAQLAHGQAAWSPTPVPAPWLLMSSANNRRAGGRSIDADTLNDESEDGNPCKDSLLAVIEKQIIPRLLEAHPSADQLPELAALSLKQPGEQEIQAFVTLCLAPDPAASHRWIKDLQTQGYSTESLFLNLIAPAARHLGEQWERDRNDFSQVTLGLIRMQQLTHELGYAYRDGPQNIGHRRRIMLASAPGSQHILGLVMVSEFFRKERWEVVVEIAATPHELTHAVANEWFDMLGLSVGVVEQLPSLPGLIQALREKSRNPDIKVLLGGPAFQTQDLEAPSMGADAIALDAMAGVLMANQLLQRPA
jgi:methanogenic corrinoid protein MtbC1